MLKKLIDFLAGLFGKQETPAPAPVTRTSAEGIKLIKHYEGVKLKAYRDPVGVLTIGYGHTGPDVIEGLEITQTQADKLLAERLANEFEPGVLAALTKNPSQHEFDAMVSLAYNVGVHAFKNSTLVKKFNAMDIQGAADEFLRWDKAGGKSLKGLRRRRAAERAMFLGADAQEAITVGLSYD
jgi:lysozyme